MTLTPDSRVLLTEALRPPPGYRVETAVGTTYSLNLTALLLAPLSFAVFDQANSTDIDALDPIRLLEAVSRHAEHTTVFCQAGGIHVPSNYGRILTFTEDSILEVMPVHEGSIFHPKIWALRFVDFTDRSPVCTYPDLLLLVDYMSATERGGCCRIFFGVSKKALSVGRSVTGAALPSDFRCWHNLPGVGSLVLYDCRFAGRSQNL